MQLNNYLSDLGKSIDKQSETSSPQPQCFPRSNETFSPEEYSTEEFWDSVTSLPQTPCNTSNNIQQANGIMNQNQETIIHTRHQPITINSCPSVLSISTMHIKYDFFIHTSGETNWRAELYAKNKRIGEISFEFCDREHHMFRAQIFQLDAVKIFLKKNKLNLYLKIGNTLFKFIEKSGKSSDFANTITLSGGNVVENPTIFDHRRKTASSNVKVLLRIEKFRLEKEF